MMLVLEVVTTALLLFAGATAQKPTNLDDASAPAVVEVVPSVTENGPVLDVLRSSAEETGYTREEVFGKGLDSEENSKEFDVDEDEDDLDEDEDDWDSYDDYDDELEDEEDETQVEDEGEAKERFKRKIIYRGQGGGGIYSRGSRRGHGGGGDEDPYGRRRDHYGQGPVDSWPYRGQDTPVRETPKITPSTTGSSTRTESSPVYGTPRKTEDSGSQSSSSSNSSGRTRNAGKRTKTERRETNKTKLSKNLKYEIAQYAMRHGPQSAAEHFQERVGRKLKVKKIEKFIRRYQERQ